jgi:hypothetical protein
MRLCMLTEINLTRTVSATTKLPGGASVAVGEDGQRVFVSSTPQLLSVVVFGIVDTCSK